MCKDDYDFVWLNSSIIIEGILYIGSLYEILGDRKN